MENKEWLESLKPGDMVALHGSYDSVIIRVVDRLTKTQIILDNGSKFRRDSGWSIVHSSCHRYFIDEVTDSVRLKIRTGNLQYKISRINFKSLSSISFSYICVSNRIIFVRTLSYF